jgi:P-type Ca2+ transporter type 2C
MQEKEVLGLTSTEAKKKLDTYGPNVLPEKPPPSDIFVFIKQLKNPLVYVLVLAGLATLLLRDYSDSIIIFIAVFINTILGFVQERKAGKALYALKQLITHEADVLRDDGRARVDTKELVPGDVVYLSQGAKVPADGRIFQANRLYIDESTLTGESIPVAKKDKEEISMGTIVSAGQCVMVVEATGRHTKVGKIALDIQELSEETPLKLQLAGFSRKLVVLIMGLILFVFAIGIFSQRDLTEMFATSVALAVSAIPEGLLISMTVILAIGMQRILRRRGLVRNLVSAETLGGVTTICLDKTGTLTVGRMQVTDALGNEDEIASQGILANDLDDPLVVAAYDWAKSKVSEKILNKHQRIDSIPFSSKERYFASLHSWDDATNIIFVNGAPELLLKITNLSIVEKEKILKQIDAFTGKGNRLMGMVRKKVALTQNKLESQDIKNDFEWVGIIAFSDPVRKGVKKALDKARLAGIKLLVITGDYPLTAVSVMKELGLEIQSDMVLTGNDLRRMDDHELKRSLAKNSKVKLFARTTPDQKLKIVEALKRNGEVVAMMGDGVNDAPALNRVDIGIVVGEATDVARESADLVLLDSRFETVIAAIEEGRGIFDNIRKVIMYLMSTAFNEITAVVGAILLGLPLPVTAAQILWINIISDGFPDLALTVEPKRKGLMTEPVRSPKESLVSPWMKVLIGIVSITSGLLALAIFFFVYIKTGDIKLSQSVGFVALGINSLVYVFSIRTLKEPFWKEGFLENKWLVVAVVVGFVLQIFPFLFESTRSFFGITTIPPQLWAVILSVTVLMFFVIEILKLFLKLLPE